MWVVDKNVIPLLRAILGTLEMCFIIKHYTDLHLYFAFAFGKNVSNGM